jgi:hypothetical protein
VVSRGRGGRRSCGRRSQRELAQQDLPPRPRPGQAAAVDELGLASADFYDLMHLVEPSRVKWQRRLASATAELLGEER